MTDEKSKETLKFIAVLIKILIDKKAVDIVKCDLRNIENSVCDFFIICSGTSSIHIKSLSDVLYKELRKKLKIAPWHIEGMENCEWVLLDYVDVVVHIFNENARDFYKLEELWADAEMKMLK